MPRAVLALAALLLLLAGCVAPAAQTEGDDAALGADAAAHAPPPVPGFDFATVVDPDHPYHSVGPLHEGGHGLALVGHAGLSAIVPPTVAGSVTQIDVAGDHAVLAGMSGGLGFALVNVSDPARPVPVSWWPATAYGHSARFSDDGAYVFYGCQPAIDPVALVFQTCRGEREIGPGMQSEIVVVDVRDKAKPAFVTAAPSGGTHNLFAAAIGGVDHVFSESGEIFRFDRENATLTLLAQVPGRHDQTVARHPVTGDWLLINGHNQLSIFNVNDPADPQVVYEGSPDAPWHGWHDQVLFPGLLDGRVVVAVAGENIVGMPVGRAMDVTFLDVTDPAKPKVLSTWTPPFVATVPWANYRFSLHEMAATPHGQLAVSLYHGGVWVVDVSTQERQAEPVTLAAFQPNKAPDVTPGYPVTALMPLETPYVWGAAWDARGHLLVPDAHTGLYVLEPEWGLWPGVDSGQ